MASESHHNQINSVLGLQKTKFIRQKNQVSHKNQVFLQKNRVFLQKKLSFSNSCDFRVRKIGCSKLHTVFPINENEFRFSEESYHFKKPNF